MTTRRSTWEARGERRRTHAGSRAVILILSSLQEYRHLLRSQ